MRANNKDIHHWSRIPEGMSLEEIAIKTGLTRNQVRSILYRALIKLRLKTIALSYKSEDFLDK